MNCEKKEKKNQAAESIYIPEVVIEEMLMLRYPPAWTLNIDRLWTNYYYYYIYAHEGNVKGRK